MRRRGIGLAACLIVLPAAVSAQAVDLPEGYGGFGGEYVQSPSLYYPYPGVIESRFGTYFSAPIVPPAGADTLVEAASIDAANAAQAGVAPIEKAKADADAQAKADEGAGALAPAMKAVARTGRRTTRSQTRADRGAPAPYRRALPRGNFDDFNQFPAGVPTYTPYARYQQYGQAYGMGPYGSNYYSGWWKGYTPMNIFNGGQIAVP